MPTMNFSIPAEIKEAFNKTFATQNKSQLVANMMQEAVNEQRQKKRRKKAISKLLSLRAAELPVNGKSLNAAREKGRP